MTAPTTSKLTPALNSREALIFGICDRLADHKRSSASVVIAPADADGQPDWEHASPTNLEALPSDEWPEDPHVQERTAVLVDEIDGCDPRTSMLVFLRHDGQPSMEQIAGPEADAEIAMRIIGRDIGARPPERQMSPLSNSLASLTSDLLAGKATPIAANDDFEPDERLLPYLQAFGGPDAIITASALFGAIVEGATGQIRIMDDGRALFVSRHASKYIDLPIRPKPVAASTFTLGDPSNLPMREWLYGGHYIRRYAVASVGPGGGGKTAHSITEALAMVTGRPLLDADGPLTKPLRVWWVNAEDPQNEIERRFHAAAKHFGVTNDQIGGRLFTDSGRDQPFVIARQEGRDLKVVEPFVADLVAEIRRRQIDVLIVDPFVSTHEAQENDNGHMQRVTAAWVRVADESNCGVELVHHATKTIGEVTAESARGGGAFKDKVRSMRVFNVMTKDEGERAGVDNPRSYFRVDFGKVNMVASGTSAWRRFVSVPLGNGTGLLKTGDEVGVVEPWKWPAAADFVSGVSESELEALKRKIAGGDYRDNIQANDWVGYPVAEALRMDLTDKSAKKTVQRMLEGWKNEGHFAIEHRSDHKGKPRPCVVPIFRT